MKRLLLSALAAAGLMIAGATTTQPEVHVLASIGGEQTAQPTDTTSKAPQQGIGQVAQQQVAISPRAFGGSMPFRYYGQTGPRRVKYGRCRWVQMA